MWIFISGISDNSFRNFAAWLQSKDFQFIEKTDNSQFALQGMVYFCDEYPKEAAKMIGNIEKQIIDRYICLYYNILTSSDYRG